MPEVEGKYINVYHIDGLWNLSSVEMSEKLLRAMSLGGEKIIGVGVLEEKSRKYRTQTE